MKIINNTVVILALFSFMNLSYAAESNIAPPSLSDINSKLSDLKLPDAPSLPSLPNDNKANNIAPAAPAMPALPELHKPPTANLITTPVVEKPKLEEKPIKIEKSKSKKSKKKGKKSKQKIVKAKKPVFANYRNDILPDTIYKKSYDNYNKHLPIAYYSNDYDKLLFISAQRDDIEGLRALLNSGRSLNIKNPQGDTPLLVAVKSNAINTTRLLLAHHANPNQSGANGITPIQVARNNGNYQIARALEEATN